MKKSSEVYSICKSNTKHDKDTNAIQIQRFLFLTNGPGKVGYAYKFLRTMQKLNQTESELLL